MHKNLCISESCCIFASEKETNNKLKPKTRKGTEKMNTTVAKRIEFQTNRKSQCIENDKPIFLFRDMDFYFLYNEDAETIGQILGASGKVAHAEDFSYAAFSANRLDQYLPAIIRKGHRVAIVDNLF